MVNSDTFVKLVSNNLFYYGNLFEEENNPRCFYIVGYKAICRENRELMKRDTSLQKSIFELIEYIIYIIEFKKNKSPKLFSFVNILALANVIIFTGREIMQFICLFFFMPIIDGGAACYATSI